MGFCLAHLMSAGTDGRDKMLGWERGKLKGGARKYTRLCTFHRSVHSLNYNSHTLDMDDRWDS